MSNNMEINEEALNNLDLKDKYDDALLSYNTLSWKDYGLLYMIFAIVLVFVIWANIATVDELTRGSGKITPSSETQVIQNLEGGIIEKFHVSEGDIVDEGQILLNMSNIQANAEYQANLKRFLTIKSNIIRFKAVADNTELVFPDSLKKDAADIVKLEIKTHIANIEQQNSQLKVLKQQLEQKSEAIKETQGKLSGIKKILNLSREEHAMIAPLAERGTVSKVELLQLNSKIAGQEAEYNNLKATLARTKAAKKETEEIIENYKNTMKADAQKEIASKTIEKNALEEALHAYKDRAKRTEIRSPVHGTIKDIKITTVGGVVQPGETILEIVPLNDQLIIEANINPSGIAFLYPGQKATIKITAYDYEIYGGITAEIKEISADTLENERGESFYRIKLQSNEIALHHNGEDLPIIPGMIASVDIMTGKKTIMNYLLSPFKKSLKSSLHER